MLTGPQKRSVILEYRFRIDTRNIAELCAKYSLTRSEFQRLRNSLGAQFATEEEMVIAGVYEGAHTIDGLIGYLDYRNHARYSAEEVRGFIDNLVSIDVLASDGEPLSFTPRAPAAKNRFVFTAPEGADREPRHFAEARKAAD